MIKKLPETLYPGTVIVYKSPTMAGSAGSEFIIKARPRKDGKYEIIGGKGRYRGDEHNFDFHMLDRQFVLLNEPWETKLSKLIAIVNQLRSLYGAGFTEEFHKLLIQLEV